MFFKRIEMTGFKSFATKTTVDLHDGVTIVVGPNGCGKSNIFDAIRWVLGEQSPKSLRGTKMGDVIFQGSDTYRPMGCAQVTLIIDNEPGYLPIDYNEVSITRRLYRNGESEYLLNKTPCRLRDIQNLFLDTGVGTESYSIMEQGRVDDIVKSRPEDRRELFEEAAGISKYKARKAEALRKLERTEHDLVRLEDRIGECRTRTISLKRQAAKAERYKALKDAANLADKKLIALDAKDLGSNFEEIESDFNRAKDRLAGLEAKNSAVENRREELTLRVEQADELLRDLSRQKEDQKGYIADLGREIIQLRSQAESEKRRAEDYISQLEENRLRRAEQARNLADIKAEEARVSVRRIALEASQNLKRAEYERLRADTESTRGKIREARMQVEKCDREAQKLRDEQTRLQMMLQQAGSFLEDFNRQKAEHEEKLRQITARVAEKERALAAKKEEIEAANNQLNETITEGRKDVDARNTLQAEHRKVESELYEARSRLKAFERLAQDYEGYYQGVKEVMLASTEHRLDGIVGVVPELMQSINSDHDLAIEIALGNHTQDIIVRTDQDAKQAIQFLKAESRRGRATFLPLNTIDGREGGPEIDKVIHRPGVIGLASKLVAYDSYIQKAVNNLLGRTLVVESIDVSMQLTRQGFRNRYVSLEGDLTFPSGVMTGGSRQGSQIMSRQREMTDLATRVEQFEAQEKDFVHRIHKREQSMLNREAQSTKLRESIQEMRLEAKQMETELSALRESRDQRSGLLCDLQERAESSQSHSGRHEEDLNACVERLVAVEQDGEKQREALHMMEDAVYERNDEVDKLGEHVNLTDQEITRLTSRCDHFRESVESMLGEVRSLDRRKTQLLNERERCYQSAQNFLEQVGRLRTEERQYEAELAGVDARRDAAAREKEEAQQARHREMEIGQRLRQELNEAHNAHSEAQSLFVNAQANLRQITDKARDRFHLSIEQICEELGEVEEERNELREEIEDLHDRIAKMGDNINMGALIEYEEEQKRLDFMTQQQTDLMEARDSLRETIDTVDRTCRQLFHEAFEAIRKNFIEVYRRLFGGGKADLHLQELEDGDSLLDGGVEIVAQPPGKKLQNVSLLSGGEKALTAVALMFSIFLYKPSPFCVMDEIDAPLDDANVRRFSEMLDEFSRRSQFIIITHNKITMGLADTMYGITMQEEGKSSIVSVSFDEAEALTETAAS